jgi:hypothetical protein
MYGFLLSTWFSHFHHQKRTEEVNDREQTTHVATSLTDPNWAHQDTLLSSYLYWRDVCPLGKR